MRIEGFEVHVVVVLVHLVEDKVQGRDSGISEVNMPVNRIFLTTADIPEKQFVFQNCNSFDDD